LTGWEVDATSEDQPQGPAGTVVAVDLTPEQAEWVRQGADAAGLTLAAFLRRLVDNERRGTGSP
jgi:hypothetical protein